MEINTMKNNRFFVLILFVLTSFYGSKAQTTFYDQGTIQKIEIYFSQPNWDYQMDTAKFGSEGYIMAEMVKINDQAFDSVGVKYKGSSSYDSTYVKNPFHISLDEFKNQSYEGIKSIKLANGFSDPSMIREVLAYDILKNYMECSRSNFAQVFINDAYIGIYSNDESVNKTFCSNHFYSSDNNFIKCNPDVAGPYSKSNFKYLSADSTAYFGKYEIESDFGWNELVSFCNTITNDPDRISAILNIDRALWMLAFNNVLVNLDSYSGWFSQNHYLYKDNNHIFNSIVWDLNMSFGGFAWAGTQGGGSGSLSVENMQEMSPMLHDNESDWPLIMNLLSNAEYKKMYIAHMKTIVDDFFANGDYKTQAIGLQSLIGEAVRSDTNKFFSYEQFLSGLTNDVQVGSHVVPGIANLMDARVSFLNTTTGFSAVPPVIHWVLPDNESPLIYTDATIRAKITGNNEGGVMMGYRHQSSQKFTKVPMYDDGYHNDSLAGDQVFGATFSMEALQAQFYVFAQNDEAAIFSPERAEHEFFTITATLPLPAPGEIVINEFLAKNNNDTINEYGSHEDWIELFNNTDEARSLFGLYLTDDFANPDKFPLPENTVIQPKGYLIIWADEEDTTTNIHSNFKLSADGEEIMLSDGGQTVIDSLTYGPQTADVSTGRCPDGTGNFEILASTSFNASNCSNGIAEESKTLGLLIKPNPASTQITISIQGVDEQIILELVNIMGQVIFRGSVMSEIIFDTSTWQRGIYFAGRRGFSWQKIIIQ
jgi:spore coat protein CotH